MMNSMPLAVPLQPANPRKRQLMEEIEASLDGWLLLKMVWFAYRKLKAI
jgi:hypothetical protein